MAECCIATLSTPRELIDGRSTQLHKDRYALPHLNRQFDLKAFYCCRLLPPIVRFQKQLHKWKSNWGSFGSRMLSKIQTNSKMLRFKWTQTTTAQIVVDQSSLLRKECPHRIRCTFELFRLNCLQWCCECMACASEWKMIVCIVLNASLARSQDEFVSTFTSVWIVDAVNVCSMQRHRIKWRK